MRHLTRREFLEFTARQSVGASLAANVLLASCMPTADQSSALGLNASETATLIALIDEIIPAGWDSNATKLDSFTDVRDLQRQLKAAGVQLTTEADEITAGPASFTAVNPDGNPILVDQHV